MHARVAMLVAAILAAGTHPVGAGADDRDTAVPATTAQPLLLMPFMSPERGRRLFAEKGCVVCHSVDGVGGEDAPPLDASTMRGPMNPFEFAARMWRGAEAMIALQREELGAQIEFTGQDLADIVAFVHSPEEQANFGEADIPERIRDLMHHEEETEGGGPHAPGEEHHLGHD